MEYVYYKGNRYQSKATFLGGVKLYSLYSTEGVLIHFINEDQLDKKSILNICMETYRKFSGHN